MITWVVNDDEKIQIISVIIILLIESFSHSR